jgi:hypothetical protein
MRLNRYPRIAGCWLYRTVRGARPDRNPLRRGTDRLETYLLAGLFAAVAAGTPFAAQAASHASYVNTLHVQQEQLATSYQARAMLTQDAAAASGWLGSTPQPYRSSRAFAVGLLSGRKFRKRGHRRDVE